MSSPTARQTSSYAQVRVREPAGERVLGETPTIGGAGSDVVVPGTDSGAALQIERRSGVWIARPLAGASVRLDGASLEGARDLQRQDVLRVGEAQLIVTDLTRTLLRIEVCHLVGNATVPPTGIVTTFTHAESGDEDLEIRAQAPPAQPAPPPPTGREPPYIDWHRQKPRIAMALVVGLLVVGLLSLLVSVSLDVEPNDARVSVPGTLVSFHVAQHLYLLPGAHEVRAERKGYSSAQTSIVASHGEPARIRLHLAKLPGTLQIDTGGVASTVSIDGADSGRVPGAIVVPAGEHTIAIRSPHYVDYIVSVEVEGALVHQSLKVKLQPSWGTLQISAIPAGAQISVDGVDAGKAPAVVDAPSGVRTVRISAAGLKVWESSVVLKAGEALNIGPITLGQPDAHLTLRSEPSGAEVTIGGTFRGRTPLEADLPAGIQHEVVVSLPGHAPWVKDVFAEAGRKLTVEARLAVVGSNLTVEGDPDDAELLIDGLEHGRTPQTFLLSAVEHRIEVRKEGRATFSTRLTPAPGLDRTIRYRLGYVEHSLAPGDVATTLYSQTGYVLRLVPQAPGAIAGPRSPDLARPFYIGTSEVTNELFRRFHPEHAAGDKSVRGADDQPVTQVTWNEAAAFCNWLSQQDNLPPAYAKAQDRYELRRPLTIGYRLPSEGEWAYVSRVAGSLGVHDLRAGLSEWVNDYRGPMVSGGPALGFRVVRYEE